MQQDPRRNDELHDSVAAVVNLHNEGFLAVPSLISAWRAVEHARSMDIAVELILCLDDPDDATRQVAAQLSLIHI